MSNCQIVKQDWPRPDLINCVGQKEKANGLCPFKHADRMAPYITGTQYMYAISGIRLHDIN